jgi:dienelactone hydrolase
MKKWWRVGLIGFGIVITVALVGVLFLLATPYTLIDLESMNSTEKVVVKEDEKWISFFPVQETDETGVIFYPGGRVEPDAYAPLAKKVAEKGVPFVIVKMPLNLAVLSPNKAEKVIKRMNDRAWVIAGHSLGGVMAARFVKENPDDAAGLILMAAYPAEEDDLTSFKGEVLTLEGQLDGVINEEELTASDMLLPSQTNTIIIQGGNHSQFGDYGLQKGDNDAEISKEEQWKRIAEAIVRSF